MVMIIWARNEDEIFALDIQLWLQSYNTNIMAMFHHKFHFAINEYFHNKKKIVVRASCLYGEFSILPKHT